MNNRTELEKQFKEECTVVNMYAEYPGNPSPIKWAIITGYSREELESKYANVHVRYSPYEIAPPETKEIYAIYNRNEDKFRKRTQKTVGIFAQNEDSNAWCPSVPSFEDELIKRQEKEEYEKQLVEAVKTALGKLTDTQKTDL